jgi:IS30 family transposase
LAFNSTLCKLVARKLSAQWSPQQIAGWLSAQHPGDPSMNVSHETIYKSLFIQARGVLKKELLAHLRSRRIMRRGRTSTTDGQTRGQIIDAVSIRDRPAVIEDRAIPGHSLPGSAFAKQMSREGEGDLLSGAKNSHIATLVERTSRFVVLVKVGGKDSESVVGALIRQVQNLPQGLMASLTSDRGTELAYHRKFTVATDVSVYFCDPRSPLPADLLCKSPARCPATHASMRERGQCLATWQQREHQWSTTPILPERDGPVCLHAV